MRMTKRKPSLAFALLLSAFPATAQPPSSAGAAPAEQVGTLTVVTSGLKDDRGKLLVHLASSRAGYESDKNPFRSAAVLVTNKRATVVFEDLPYGEYAVKVFHDANDNQKLDFGLMGPKESYGFSNNVRGLLGPADYDDAKFRLESATLSIEIRAK